MRCATRISRTPVTRVAHGPKRAWGGTCIVRAVGTIHHIQVGKLHLPTGLSACLQCTVSTSSFFSVDGTERDSDTSPSLARPTRSPLTLSATASEMPSEGSVYMLHIVGPDEFVADAAEVLGDDVLVEVAGRLHVEPYTYWKSGKYECPTVRLTYKCLQSTEHTLRVLHAPEDTGARQRRLYRAIFRDQSL